MWKCRAPEVDWPPLRVALIGASGYIGSPIARELLARGHQVTAIVRRPERVVSHLWMTAIRGDLTNVEELTRLVAGHEAMISSARFSVARAEVLIAAAKVSGVNRLLVVGGAGSLEVQPGLALVDTPDFPEKYRQGALAGRQFLGVLRGESELDWTFLSPSRNIAPGERTGKFRIGGDQLLVDDEGRSRISLEDFAMAMVDELEAPRHTRRRFTVGY